MSTDAASLRPALKDAALPRLRGAALAGALGAAFLLRLVLVWSRATPNYFPDEYLYAALGRSLAGLGVPSVRGHAAHFPALLQPLLTAAAWRAGSLETGYRLVQALGAAAFTLAAVPAYLLARRVGLARGIAVAIAGLALLVPDGLYAGFVLAEPFAYPLVLGAVAAGVAALARPSRRNQLLFLLLAGLAAFARTQFGVLAACFVAGVVIVGLRERSLRRTLREQRLPLACIGLAAAAAVTLAAVRGLGYYASAGHVHAHPAALSKAIGVNLTVLMYAAGWVLVPGAVLGLALALARPRTRVELALGALTLVTSTALLLEAALWGDTGMVQERYVFYVLPLAAICFGLYASRGWPLRRGHAVLALGLVLLAARLPLSGYSRPGADDHSPLLLAVQRLGMIVGGDATAATVIAAVATVLAFAAAAAAWRPRLGTPVLLALAFLVSAGALAGASDFDRLNSAAAHRRYLPADRSWVDHAGVGSATLVTAYGGRPADAEEQLFWNRSLQRVAVLPGGGPPDRLAAAHLSIGKDGRLLDGTRPLRGPLVVDGYSGTIELRGARPVAAAPHFRLWVPAGTPRLAMYVPGRTFDGYIGDSGAIVLWPTTRGLAGWLDLDVAALPGTTLDLRLGDRVVHGGHVRLRVCSAGRWSIPFASGAQQVVGRRLVAGHMSKPVFRADPSACRS